MPSKLCSAGHLKLRLIRSFFTSGKSFGGSFRRTVSGKNQNIKEPKAVKTKTGKNQKAKVIFVICFPYK